MADTCNIEAPESSSTTPFSAAKIFENFCLRRDFESIQNRFIF